MSREQEIKKLVEVLSDPPPLTVVRVMRSRDWCNFEVTMSRSCGTADEVRQLRREVAQQVDEAVNQYLADRANEQQKPSEPTRKPYAKESEAADGVKYDLTFPDPPANEPSGKASVPAHQSQYEKHVALVPNPATDPGLLLSTAAARGMLFLKESWEKSLTNAEKHSQKQALEGLKKIAKAADEKKIADAIAQDVEHALGPAPSTSSGPYGDRF